MSFQTIVADVDALYREGAISLPEKETETVEGGFYVVELYVEALTPFGKEVLRLYPPSRRP